MVADGTVDELVSQRSDVVVRCTDPARLASLLRAAGGTVAEEDQALGVTGLTTDEIGHLAFDGGVTVLELATRKASLEETFMQLTGDDQQFAFGEAS